MQKASGVAHACLVVRRVIPAGRYQVSHMEPRHYLPHIDPALAFDGATPCRAYYLGDLEVDIETTSWLGGLWGDYITRLDRLEVPTASTPARAASPAATVVPNRSSRRCWAGYTGARPNSSQTFRPA